jgi:hypothetical protein
MKRTETTPPSRPEDENEVIVEEFLEGQPRADVWRELKETLLARYKDAVAVRDAMDPDDPAFPAQEKRVREMREQVNVLAEEEAVTQFVEDSVRASLSRPAVPRSAEDVDDEEGYY